ncbi:MAG: NAD(P)/FAD-dependent oxidoreductase, partial [Verrucomicrobiota bacterium]
SAQSVAETAYGEERAKALFAGHAAHSVLSLRQAGTGAFGLILGISGHSVGWPVVRGGSAEIAHALVALFERAGGTLVCQAAIEEVGDLPSAKAYVYDTSPRALLALYEELFPPGYRNALQGYQWGPGVCKVDWALSDPIPWRDPEASKTATLHLGGTLAEVSESEDACLQGRMVERPFVLLSQPSLVDEGRAPEGKHTAWAYCHVPHGYDRDVTDLIAAQVERFAPGFRETILAAHTMTAPAMARYNPNYVGGDVVGGRQTLWQQVARPALRWDPYQTPLPGVYLCSASTPPGPGVHGMCGARAAGSVMRWLETRGHLPL